MDFKRLFGGEDHKGEQGYLATQRKYELAKTLIYFGIAFAILILGIISTGTKNNLLTIVAVLGMLPASKSLVETIMFFRFKGCDKEDAKLIADTLQNTPDLQNTAFDTVFTTYKVNYKADHLCVHGSDLIIYSRDFTYIENDLKEHLTTTLATEKLNGITIKVFAKADKYTDRLKTLSELPGKNTDAAVLKVLKDISL